MKKENMIIKAFNNHLFNQNKRQKEQGDNTFFLFILKGKKCPDNKWIISVLQEWCSIRKSVSKTHYIGSTKEEIYVVILINVKNKLGIVENFLNLGTLLVNTTRNSETKKGASLKWKLKECLLPSLFSYMMVEVLANTIKWDKVLRYEKNCE